MSNRLPLIAAVILGLLAVFLSNRYFQKKEKELFQGTKPKPVLVATHNIDKNTIVKKNDIKIVKIPAKFIQPSAVASVKAVVDKITTAFILKGEQIVSTKLISPEKGRWLAIKTPSGKRAVTISADSVTGVGGLVKPGDYVDILGTFDLIKIGESGKQEVQSVSLPLFQNVLVLAVDQEMSKFSLPKKEKKIRIRKEGEISTVTLALSPQEAENLVFAEEKGKIRLMLRAPDDSQKSPLPIVNFSTLLKSFSSYISIDSSEKRTRQTKKGESIEVFRGLEKEEITTK